MSKWFVRVSIVLCSVRSNAGLLTQLMKHTQRQDLHKNGQASSSCAQSPRHVAVRDRRPFPSSVPKATQAGAPAVPPWNRVPRTSAPWSVVPRQWHQPLPQRDRYSRSSPYIWIPSCPGRRHPCKDSNTATSLQTLIQYLVHAIFIIIV